MESPRRLLRRTLDALGLDQQQQPPLLTAPRPGVTRFRSRGNGARNWDDCKREGRPACTGTAGNPLLIERDDTLFPRVIDVPRHPCNPSDEFSSSVKILGVAMTGFQNARNSFLHDLHNLKDKLEISAREVYLIRSTDMGNRPKERIKITSSCRPQSLVPRPATWS